MIGKIVQNNTFPYIYKYMCAVYIHLCSCFYSILFRWRLSLIIE